MREFVNFLSWLEINLSWDHKNHRPWNIPWNIIFAYDIWQLWKARNSYQFENTKVLPNETANKTIRYAKETVLAFTNNLNRNTAKNTNLIN